MNGRMTRVFLAVCILALGAVAVAQAELGWTFSWNQSLANMASRDVALDDLDGDGDLDAYVANDNYEYDHIWINQGGDQEGTAGRFELQTGMSQYPSQAVALDDLDGDGHVDAFVVHYNQPNRIYINDGDGVLVEDSQDLGTFPGQDVALGDFDGVAGIDAFVVNDYPHADMVWLNDGTGIFQVPPQDLGSTASRAVALGKLNADEHLDAFVAVYGPNVVWLNDGNGGFYSNGQDLGAGLSYDVALGYIDDDAFLDAVVANDGLYHEVWFGLGNGQFEEIPLTFGEGQGFGVALGDLDGNPGVDVVIANADPAQPNKVWLNDGSGGLSDSELAVGLGATQAVALGTLDATASLDLFVANHGVESEVWIKTTPTNVGLRQMEASAAVAWWAPVLGALLVLTLFSWRRQRR